MFTLQSTMPSQIYIQERQIVYHQQPYARMFIAILLIVLKIYK